MSKKDSTAVVDRDIPEVEEGAEAMDLARQTWNMNKIDPHAALVAFEAAAELLRKLTPASIKATRPQDWVKMGEKVYLQATGVERVAPLWGLYFGEPRITREEYQGGDFSYIVNGKIGSRFTGIEIVVEGARSSSDPFFDAFDQDKPREFYQMEPADKEAWKRAHRVAPDPMDVRKAAVTNWMTRGASMLCGLRGLTPKDLDDNGIRGVAVVEYGKGQKGGSTAPADLKAEQTRLHNDIHRRTGGDVGAARDLLKEVTKFDAYTKKDGTKVKAHEGYTSTDQIKNPVSIRIAFEKLAKHPIFGDKAKGAMPPPEEPGTNDGPEPEQEGA